VHAGAIELILRNVASAEKTLRPTVKHHAPDAFFGYSLQAARMVCRLLEAKAGEAISLEVFDDVGVQSSTSQVAEQTKSGRKSNPIADTSVGLWKTFANWIQSIAAGELDLQRTWFEIYVSAPKPAAIAKRFSDCTDVPDALRIIAEVKTQFWGEAPDFAKRAALPKTAGAFINAVLAADHPLVAALICRFTLREGRGNIGTESKDLLTTKFVSRQNIDVVYKQALGWVHARLLNLLEIGKPGIIQVDDFYREIAAFNDRCASTLGLISCAEDPTLQEVEPHLLRPFVRQLRLIDVPIEDQILAVSNYLRASSDRTMWAEKGLIDRSAVAELAADLKNCWKNTRTKTELLHAAHPEVERGKILYSDCCLHRARIRAIEMTAGFTQGSFHELADSRDIGWHPQYLQLLPKDEVVK
jgi:hypothetical protein